MLPKQSCYDKWSLWRKKWTQNLTFVPGDSLAEAVTCCLCDKGTLKCLSENLMKNCLILTLTSANTCPSHIKKRNHCQIPQVFFGISYSKTKHLSYEDVGQFWWGEHQWWRKKEYKLKSRNNFFFLNQVVHYRCTYICAKGFDVFATLSNHSTCILRIQKTLWKHTNEQMGNINGE